MILYTKALKKYLKQFLKQVESYFYNELVSISIKQENLVGSPNFNYQSTDHCFNNSSFRRFHPSLLNEYLEYKHSYENFSKDSLFMLSYISALPIAVKNQEMLAIYLPKELLPNRPLKFKPTTNKPIKLDYQKFFDTYFYYKLLMEL